MPVPKTPPPRKEQQKGRRSARSREQEKIVLPGFGTDKDLQRLAAELSQGSGTTLPVEAVEAIMKSGGRGIRSSRSSAAAAAAAADETPQTAAAVSTAWADFMKEEGAENLFGASGSTAAAAVEGRQGSSAARGSGISSQKRVYELDALRAAARQKKKAKRDFTDGVLVQTGTLDSASAGRAKLKLEDAPYHLKVPTSILPGIRISKVFTSANAVHSIALDESTGTAYGWGRNEASQLGSDLPDDVVLPVELEFPDGQRLVSAATGKSHTIFLMEDRSLYAVGLNKSGQCGIRSSTESVPNYRKCVLPEDVKIIQVACGEDFSVALSSEGHVYTTGSSEYGQLGNGETGQYFISANKLGFANCNVFTRRTTFCHAPKEKLHTSNERAEVVPIEGCEDIRIQNIACGKHHTLALEATSDQTPRVFSWGCGDYGCLGHGVQADEYFPRLIGIFSAASAMRIDLAGRGRLSVSAGAHCSLLQTANGHVYYWGKHRSVGEATMRPQLVDVLANNQHVVTHAAAGGQTVVCSTANAQTVAWGQGPHGELGLGEKKSSAKPTFVEALNGCRVADLACGYGHTLYVVRNEDKEDKAAVKKLEELDVDAIQPFVDATAAKGSKKRE